MTARKVGEENNFAVENLELGSYNHTAKFTHALNPGASSIDPNGNETAQIITLDSYVRENNLPRVDFIKMDVEGAELDILKGAATTIARFKPILALSAYHKWEDFWTLTSFIKSIRPDYEFAMRQSYVTPENEPANFKNGVMHLVNLGLEPDGRNFYECVLFAR
ncbi:MAG: FkbM family methyltransferase [Selenomonadaceae bacterium]|nr:FkbM family methyltransferase [Selenomonadaceae bacterium]